MSKSVNRVTLVGTIGRDPDVQTKESGAKVAHCSVATTRRIPRDSGYEDRTEWHRVTMYDRLAEIAEGYLRKGDRVYVEGRIEYGCFERHDIVIPTTEIVVHDLVLIGTPGRFDQYADIGESESVAE